MGIEQSVCGRYSSEDGVVIMAMTPDFDTVIEQLNNAQLWSFPGGVHPPGRKSLSNQTPIASLPLPEILYIPVKQHTGTDADIIVSVGENVLKGQALTQSTQPFAVPVHAPTSGIIQDITEHPSAHPSGIGELTIILQPDGNDTWAELKPLQQYQTLSKDVLVEHICDAGIAGLGGAGFPTHIKVQPPKAVEFLIINGIECEPYITSDDRLMREHAWQIRQGIDVVNHLIEAKTILVAVEDNKPDALNALTIACQDNPNIRVVSIPTVYPAGGEKQLIQVLTGREVPRKGLPADVGCVMFNVGTCFAIADAVFSGKPLTQRVVTLTGDALQTPQNVWALLGTPIAHLLAHAGYSPKKQTKPNVIMGGPMMGFTVTSLNVPVVKITNCLLVPAKQELPDPNDERACIRCGFCTDACPASLLPQQLYWYSKAQDLDKAQEYNLFDCIECGACAYVCPSEIPLVHYYRKTKADIRNQRDEHDKAEKARIRFEARKARLLADKEAREEKHRLAAEQRKRAMESGGGSAKDKIAAALARAKAKKAQQIDGEAPATEKPVKTKAQLAVERAKAKKAAREATSAETAEESTSAEDAKQDKVKAAVARAKAKREAKITEQQAQASKPEVEADQETLPESGLSEADIKKQKVAKALAKAKARAAEKRNNENPSS